MPKHTVRWNDMCGTVRNADMRSTDKEGRFFRHYENSLSWQEERNLEHRKSSVRCKVEYVFHVVKDIFGWRKARYKGFQKNQDYAYLAFASANLYMLTRYV